MPRLGETRLLYRTDDFIDNLNTLIYSASCSSGSGEAHERRGCLSHSNRADANALLGIQFQHRA
jgi:hypothetical protein